MRGAGHPRDPRAQQCPKLTGIQVPPAALHMIIDGRRLPTLRTGERWQPDASRPEIIADFLEWHPLQADRALVIDLAVLFDVALGA